MIEEILFLVVLFLSNILQTITGFAGTVLAMPPSMILLGVDDAKVVLNAMAWLSGLLISIQNYKYINKKELFKMSSFMIIGMLIGIRIYAMLSSDILLTIYGVIVVAIGLKNLCIKKQYEHSKLILSLVLIIAGIIHGMFVSGGALLVIYAVGVMKDKNEFRATVAPIWVILNSYMMISYAFDGMVNLNNMCLIGLSVIPLFIAIWIGNKIQVAINQKIFLKITYVLLIISGLSIVI